MNLASRTTPWQVWLAWVAFTQGNLAQVQDYVEEVQENLDTRVLNLLEPFCVYLICYRILQANQDHRAPKLQATAHSLIQKRAARISDDELRHSFVETVVAHREIVSEYEEQSAQKAREPRTQA